MNAPRKKAAHGFTLIELLIAVSVLAIMMSAIGNVTSATNDAVEIHNRSAEVATMARRNLQRVSWFTRPAKLSTIKVQATAIDVKYGYATNVGEWIDPPPIGATPEDYRPGIQFLAASSVGGKMVMNAALSTATRELIFTTDPGEIAGNNIDDDGDDLVDEGYVSLEHEGVTITVVRNVMECEFKLDGRLLTVQFELANRDSKGRIHTSKIEQHIYLRNN